ncbi:MAG: hypothetical protein ACTHJ9_14020 [Rhodanobacter sp.]
MTDREAAIATLTRLDAEDLIPMLGLDQEERTYMVQDAFRPGRIAARTNNFQAIPSFTGRSF